MAEPMSVAFEVSAAFVLAEDVPMTAADLGYGFERGFLKPAEVVGLATHEVGRGTDDDVLVALGSLLRDELDRVPEALELLDDPERVHDPRESARKWLYLQLKAAYDERERVSDPLGFAEEIYADFDYPPAVASFVRYMPLRPGDEPGIGPLMGRWRDYLDRERMALRGRPASAGG
jgi:hypothetical protein